MFTGIIRHIGTVDAIQINPDGARIVIRVDQLEPVLLGDSIAVNGICLTVVAQNGGFYTFDVSKETLNRTTLGLLTPHSLVNVEQALKVGDRLDGHYVSGHIDATAELLCKTDSDVASNITIKVPEHLCPFLAPKGSVTLDGVSLTINARVNNCIDLTVIPHTMSHTILCHWAVGSIINLEVDMLARYVINAQQ